MKTNADTTVVHVDEVEPERRDGDTAETRLTFSAHLEQRFVSFAPGRSRPRRHEGRQEILYVVAGGGELVLDGTPHPLEPDTGAFVAAGETYEVDNPGPEPLVLLSVTAPQEHTPHAEKRRVTVRFGDQPELVASQERRFRYLVNQEAGCPDVTQFVGLVDPSRAPEHSHTYDEVGFVAEGEGVAHVDGEEVPLRAGSCFHLRPGQVHCIENSGTGRMRIVGVFHPSGDPASRQYPDNI